MKIKVGEIVIKDSCNWIITDISESFITLNKVTNDSVLKSGWFNEILVSYIITIKNFVEMYESSTL